MHHIDKGARHYLRVNEQWRNYNWQSICSEVGHLSDEGADVLVLNPAAKSRGKEKMTDICGASYIKGISNSSLGHILKLLTLLFQC